MIIIIWTPGTIKIAFVKLCISAEANKTESPSNLRTH